jgi:hypothetical protein
MLNLEEGVVIAKLRGMHSLLEVSASDNFVGVHHISFLEFLERGCSQDYRMTPRRANRIFLNLCTRSIIRIYWGMIRCAMIFHFGPYSNNNMFIGSSMTRSAQETFMKWSSIALRNVRLAFTSSIPWSTLFLLFCLRGFFPPRWNDFRIASPLRIIFYRYFARSIRPSSFLLLFLSCCLILILPTFSFIRGVIRFATSVLN